MYLPFTVGSLIFFPRLFISILQNNCEILWQIKLFLRCLGFWSLCFFPRSGVCLNFRVVIELFSFLLLLRRFFYLPLRRFSLRGITLTVPLLRVKREIRRKIGLVENSAECLLDTVESLCH